MGWVTIDAGEMAGQTYWDGPPAPLTENTNAWGGNFVGTIPGGENSGQQYSIPYQLQAPNPAALAAVGWTGSPLDAFKFDPGSGGTQDVAPVASSLQFSDDLSSLLSSQQITSKTSQVGNDLVQGFFNSSGAQVGPSTVQDAGISDPLFIYAALAAAAVVAAPVIAGAAGAGAGAAAPAVGNGAFLGEGIASGVGAWDAAATSAGLTLSSTGGAAIAADSLIATGNGAFLGEGVASGVPAWDAAATTAGLDLAAPAAALPSLSSGSSSLLPSASSVGSAVGSAGSIAKGLAPIAALIGQLTGTPQPGTATAQRPPVAQQLAGLNPLVLIFGAGLVAFVATRK